MKKTIVILLVLGSYNAICQQDRNVYWVHGLGEDSDTWQAMEDIFDVERRMNNDINTNIDNSLGYPAFDGVNDATANVIGDIENTYSINGSTNDRNIGIGHSLGGNILRDIDATELGNNQRFGGLITVGTPNNGAMISNNLANGTIDQAINHACDEVMAGPNTIINPLLNFLGQIVAPHIFCRVLKKICVDPLLGAQQNVTASNLMVGSLFINTTYINQSNIPKISIWGNEQSPVHWRLASSFETDNLDERVWIDRVADLRAVYHAFYVKNTGFSVATGLIGFINPIAWIGTGAYAWRAHQWNRGVNWVDNSEGMWNVLIDCGSTRTETITVSTGGTIDCDCVGFTGSQAWIDCVNQYCDPYPTNCFEDPVNYSVEVVINGRSDGYICEDAQIINGTATTDHYRADRANHNEETEPFTVVQDRLRSIWNGQNRVFDDFFITEVR